MVLWFTNLQKKEESRQTCIKVVTLPRRTDILLQGDLPAVRVGATLPCGVVILGPIKAESHRLPSLCRVVVRSHRRSLESFRKRFFPFGARWLDGSETGMAPRKPGDSALKCPYNGKCTCRIVAGQLFRWSFEQRTPEPGPASANMAPFSVRIKSVQGLYGAVWRKKRIFVLQQAFYDSILSLYGS